MNKVPSKAIHIIGAGLAGSEAALQLAKQTIPVRVFDLKPTHRSPAHHSPQYAEIVCSNSLGSQGPTTASGLLKLELEQLDCQLLQIAQQVAVPAGKALAVDREAFSAAVTHRLQNTPGIELVCAEVTDIQTALPDNSNALRLIATGPMTTDGLAQTLSHLLNHEQLYFFDAAAPIITRESIDMSRAFVQDRYGQDRPDGSEAGQSYINCPLSKPQYLAFVEKLLNSERIGLKTFEEAAMSEQAQYFESCLPVEVIASRGVQTLRYGPMKPVGLINPHETEGPYAGKPPYAVVQLRQDNAEGTLYNMVGFQTNLKWGAQKELIQMIPGLENADIVRYGVMHRNTYLHSPDVLLPTLQLKAHPQILIAGQLTGTEGYTESIATGLLAARNLARLWHEEAPITLPRETMLGALTHYITRPEAMGKSFQPINSNWGLLPELPERVKDKALRREQLVTRALAALESF